MLQTPYVFIDTEVFVASNFSYGAGRLKRLHELCSDKRIQLVSVDITHREIEARIQAAVRTATQHLQGLRDKGRILQTASDPQLWKTLAAYDEPSILSDLKDQLSAYEVVTGMNVLSSTLASSQDVFDRYFSQVAPFGEKKK